MSRFGAFHRSFRAGTYVRESFDGLLNRSVLRRLGGQRPSHLLQSIDVHSTMPISKKQYSSSKILSGCEITTRKPATDVEHAVESELASSLDGVGRDDGRHRVYVVRLDPEVLCKKTFTDANPDRDASGLCLYVGLTGLTPSQRLENHKNDYKASRWVRDYGLGLMPRLYEPLNKMSYSRADEVEEILASFLREKGHAVWQK